MMLRFTLSKSERLSSRKAIDSLFEEGQGLSKHPIRVVWRTVDPDPMRLSPIQVMFSVPRRKFPRAADRNRVKRLMREAYRLYKPTFTRQVDTDMHLDLALIYTGHEIKPLDLIQKQLVLALEAMVNQLPQ